MFPINTKPIFFEILYSRVERALIWAKGGGNLDW